MARIALLALFLSLLQLTVAYKWYDQYQVIRAFPTTNEHIRALRHFLKRSHELELDVWKKPTKVGRSVDIMVHKDKFSMITGLLSFNKIPWKIGIENVKNLIERSKKEFDSRKVFIKGTASSNFTIDEYHNTQEINDWIDSLATTYPLLVSTFSIGKSHEGRDMRVIKIGAAGTNKIGFWMDATIHAREWITSGTINWIINELTSKYSTTYQTLLNSVDFYILPIVNPDGYEYTINTDRNWRKTRSGPYKTGLKQCYGVDANRNWDNHWGGAGSSDNACSDTYEGPSAMSEVEVSNVANWMLANKDKLTAYVTMHSYGDYFMYPYSYAQNTYMPNNAQINSLGASAVAAIKAVNGTVYSLGSVADILYDADGSSMDWAVDSVGFTIPYALELRPGDGDTVDDQSYGFFLPASYIETVSIETWAGLQVVADSLLSS